MCGIVGYVGDEQAAPILLTGLSKLEYRGYDSAGIAVRNEATDKIAIVKAKGRLKTLIEKTDGGSAVPGTCGIGHTRWATHGEPSETNAHPHCTDDKSVVLVHNGIIENYQELKAKLLRSGYTFYSQTDTEVAVKLVDYYYKKTGTPLEAISRAMLRIRGSYAFGVIFKDYPGKLFAARKDSPLIIGKSEHGSLIGSDVPAILDQTRNVYYIDNMEIAELTKDEIHFFNLDEEEIEKEMNAMEEQGIICGYPTLINWDKTGCEHVTALIEVTVAPERGRGFDKVAERIYQFDEVESLYLMSGSGFDLTVIIVGKTMKEVAWFGESPQQSELALLRFSPNWRAFAVTVLPPRRERYRYSHQWKPAFANFAVPVWGPLGRLFDRRMDLTPLLAKHWKFPVPYGYALVSVVPP